MTDHNHPFVLRLKLEREVIRTVNAFDTAVKNPLVGLGEEAVEQWIRKGLDPRVTESKRASLREQLLEISGILRWSASASHRGIAPTEKLVGNFCLR